jgi:hypothetical protein
LPDDPGGGVCLAKKPSTPLLDGLGPLGEELRTASSPRSKSEFFLWPTGAGPTFDFLMKFWSKGRKDYIRGPML